MSKRLPNSRSPNECGLPNQFRKNTKKNNLIDESWHNYDRDRENFEPSDDEYSGIDYPHMLHQQPRLHQPQPHPPHNGQRLFTAMSDPGVCGYPQPVPIPYTLEPVSLPPMYHQYYQPVVRLNYRPYRTRPRTSSRHVQNGPPNSNDIAGNGYSSLQENGWSRSPHMSHQNGDYASLPPTANMDNPDNREELNSEHRRYSDPGLGPADSSNLKNEDTDTESSSVTTIERNNRLFMTLVDQMTRIKETNSQLFKELHQAKSELETVKTELQYFKQNIPPDYQPGIFTDIIKEIRDANKIKEEAMLSKVKSLFESHPTQRLIDLEELKIQLEKVKRGKEESEERIDKLEKEIAELRLRLNSENHREIAAFEEENLALRRELQEARASKKQTSKIQRLMGMLQDKSKATPGESKDPTVAATTVVVSGSSSSSDSEDNEIFTSNEFSKSNSPTNSSNNSLATGPVTDL